MFSGAGCTVCPYSESARQRISWSHLSSGNFYVLVCFSFISFASVYVRMCNLYEFNGDTKQHALQIFSHLQCIRREVRGKKTTHNLCPFEQECFVERWHQSSSGLCPKGSTVIFLASGMQSGFSSYWLEAKHSSIAHLLFFLGNLTHNEKRPPSQGILEFSLGILSTLIPFLQIRLLTEEDWESRTLRVHGFLHMHSHAHVSLLWKLGIPQKQFLLKLLVLHYISSSLT